MYVWLITYGLPIIGAIAAGALIGLEREYRGHAAGFRTHILVSLAAALLMLAAGHYTQWLTHFAPETISSSLALLDVTARRSRRSASISTFRNSRAIARRSGNRPGPFSTSGGSAA